MTAALSVWRNGPLVLLVVWRNGAPLVLLVAAERHAETWGPLTVQGPPPSCLPWSSRDLTGPEVLAAYAALEDARDTRRAA